MKNILITTFSFLVCSNIFAGPIQRFRALSPTAMKFKFYEYEDPTHEHKINCRGEIQFRATKNTVSPLTLRKESKERAQEAVAQNYNFRIFTDYSDANIEIDRKERPFKDEQRVVPNDNEAVKATTSYQFCSSLKEAVENGEILDVYYSGTSYPGSRTGVWSLTDDTRFLTGFVRKDGSGLFDRSPNPVSSPSEISSKDLSVKVIREIDFNKGEVNCSRELHKETAKSTNESIVKNTRYTGEMKFKSKGEAAALKIVTLWEGITGWYWEYANENDFRRIELDTSDGHFFCRTLDTYRMNFENAIRHKSPFNLDLLTRDDRVIGIFRYDEEDYEGALLGFSPSDIF